jgi:undecaprenyl-diphosphatase
MQHLLALDYQIFLVINHLPHTAVLYALAMTVSGALSSMVIIWILFSVLLFVREEKKDHKFFIPVLLAISLSFIISEWILKNVFARSRPQGAFLTDYSFPSSHATIAWALAIVLAAKEPRAKYVFYILAFLVSLSRIYLGVHYPSDVLAGGLLGAGIGYFSLWVERNMVKYKHVETKRKRVTHHTRRRRGGKGH